MFVDSDGPSQEAFQYISERGFLVPEEKFISEEVFLADEFPDFPHAVNTERASTAERPTAINFLNFIIISFFLYCIECNITSYKINCN